MGTAGLEKPLNVKMILRFHHHWLKEPKHCVTTHAAVPKLCKVLQGILQTMQGGKTVYSCTVPSATMLCSSSVKQSRGNHESTMNPLTAGQTLDPSVAPLSGFPCDWTLRTTYSSGDSRASPERWYVVNRQRIKTSMWETFIFRDGS